MTVASVDDRALRTACVRAGLSGARLSLLHKHATDVYLLEPHRLVVRASAVGDDRRRRAHTAVAITRWLVGQGFPATAPADVEQPIEVEDIAFTFWHFYPQRGSAHPGAAELGRLLRDLHRLPAPPADLEPYLPLRRLGQALRSTTTVSDRDRSWLARRRTELLNAYENVESLLGEGLIHGDAYPGNMLWNGDQTVLGDWDEIAHGPRELDLVNTHQGRRFGRDATECEVFNSAYGSDVTTWGGFATLRDIRDLHTLAVYIEKAGAGDTAAAAELLHRINTLREADTEATWQAA